MDMSKYSEPLPTELEQIVDEARRESGLGPAPRPALTGVADMEARINYHSNLLARLRALPPAASLTDTIADCERQLAEAQERLREYRLQHDSRN